MPAVELFSKRQKRLRGESIDVYSYEELPEKLRIQIVHIIKDTIGQDTFGNKSRSAYDYIHKTLCKEFGLFSLQKYSHCDEEAILNYFLDADYEECLDIIEISFRIIEDYVGRNYHVYKQDTNSRQDPEDAISELNLRFKESGIGYQFESGELLRVDSKFIHSEAVKPALYLLKSTPEFEGANDEFLSAHDHYRHKRFKECLNDCLKSFESLMKAIHDKHSWEYGKKDTAHKLIESCLSNNLVPAYLQSQFSALRTLLETGVPTIRNNEGGHGQGSEISNVPDHLASYILHLTATNLLFLMNCEKDI